MASSITIAYLDLTVLENHHIAATFNTMERSPECNFLAELTRVDMKRVRSLMIKCVLSTDMSKHSSDLSSFKSRTESAEFNSTAGADKDLALTMIFHISDISNATKPWDLCRHWTEILFTEFFN